MTATDEIERLRAALAACESWLDRWTEHVGNCEGGNECTCGRTAILHEARAAIAKAEDMPIEDLKIEAIRRSLGAGGQHVGAESCVRVTHLPTGLTAECKTERSQHRNKEIALDMIRGGLTSPHMR